MKKLLFITIALIFANILNAQTGYTTVINEPCNFDGILAVTVTSGLTPPLTFNYNNGAVIHNNINSLTDTAYGLNYESSYPNGYVYITDSTGANLYLSIGFQAPFSIDYPTLTYPYCPDTMGTVEFTINGGNNPSVVEYYTTSGIPMGSGNPMFLPAGNSYDVYVIDGNGCYMHFNDSIMGSIYIYQQTYINFQIATTIASCTDGTASINNITGGVPPYYYLWSNGLTTDSIGNLILGNYEVTVTDSIGCSKIKSFNITQFPSIFTNYTTVLPTCTQNDGSITAYGSGGTSPYTYNWGNGNTSQTLGGLSGGNFYPVTVTDANGCLNKTIKYLGSSTPVTATYSTTPSSCTSPTGTATLTINGGTTPYNVTWSTFPVQTGLTATNLSAGTYYFEITDSIGCIRTGNVVIPDVGNMSAAISVTSTPCNMSNGSLTAYANGNYPPFTYNWSNSATTQTINNLPHGSYSCTISDSNGCSLVKTKSVSEISPVHLIYTVVPASCRFTSDGSITLSAYGGTPPYTYSIAGQSSSTVTGLSRGHYICHVTDANGCGDSHNIYVSFDSNNDSCYCTLTGHVYVDNISNCMYDIGEELVENVNIHCNYFGHNFTDSAGVYTILVPTGNYTLSEVVQYYYPLATCQNNSITVNAVASSGCVITNDFANIINPLHDIKVESVNSPAIPGFTYTQNVIVTNDGTISENNIQYGYGHDGQLSFSNSSLAFVQNDPINYPEWYSINNGFPTLNPADHQNISIIYNVPANIPIGTEVVFYDTVAYDSPISLWSSDYSPWNNVLRHTVTIVGSYDPNCKEVTPKGIGPEGLISTADTTLTYSISFENIGNYSANKIVIIDTLDPDLDWLSLRPGYSTHSYVADLSEDGILTFTFENINLPPPNTWYEEANKGFVVYSIKQNPSLSIGTVIDNSASIFFDYNTPIFTNTVINTISEPMVIIEHITSSIIIYPNPTTGLITIKNEKSIIKNVSVFDIYGKEVLMQDVTLRDSKCELNLSQQAKGIYIIKVQTERGVAVEKVILN